MDLSETGINIWKKLKQNLLFSKSEDDWEYSFGWQSIHARD